MPEFCKYGNCHNLASWTYQGYCNEDHLKRGSEHELLMKIIYETPGVATIKDARQFLQKKRDERNAPKTPSPPTTIKKTISDKDH
jgi:hypothetical protein